MGIPGLTARLKPYAEPIQWTRRDPETQQEHARVKHEPVIIDGPSLAYHIYGKCLRSHSTAEDASQLFPSYSDLADEAVRFLANLECLGLHVHKIYFDGDLPESKRDIRLDRLQNSLNKLRVFRAANPSLTTKPDSKTAPNHQLSTASSSKFSWNDPSRRSASPPAPPFLVPIVIEALLGSTFSTVIAVVPGEADTFCAAAADQDHRTMILTNDSDLLVQCPSNRIVLFNDVEWDHAEIANGHVYRPSKIANRLGWDNFRDIVYFLASDPHRTVVESVQLAKKQSGWDKYDVSVWHKSIVGPVDTLDILPNATPAQKRFVSSIDPRISEMIHDLFRITDLPPSSTNSGCRSVHVYLPFLIDDPTRSSAWSLSNQLRIMAYSVLRVIRPSPNFSEFNRRCQRVKEISVRDLLDTASLTDRFLVMAGPPRSDLPATNAAFYRRNAILYILERLKGASDRPELDCALNVSCYPAQSLTSWSELHFKAQIEAYLYSLRMLYLVLRYYIEYTKTPIKAFKRFYKTLKGMPPLVELMHGLSADESKGLRSDISAIYKTSEYEYKEGQLRSPKRRKKNRQEEMAPQHANLYDYLIDEE